MKKLVLLGWPVRHSRSPAMQNAALRALELSHEYEAVEVHPNRLAEVVAELRREGFLGGNVTVPHKRSIVTMCDEVDDLAAKIGAVNTLVHRNGRLHGLNTDVEGFRRSVREAGVDTRGARVVVLGAGGAAQAIVEAVGHDGASVTVVARHPENATDLAHEIIPWSADRLAEALAGADLLVNASSAGMDRLSPPCRVPIDRMPSRATVFDLVYGRVETALLGQARARGLRTIDGLRMLLHQGAASFQAWTGCEPPLRIMEQALSVGRC